MLKGDQIGRTFAILASVTTGIFYKLHENLNFGDSSFNKHSFCSINYDEIWIGLYFGRFFHQKHLVTLSAIFMEWRGLTKIERRGVAEGLKRKPFFSIQNLGPML
jgi:hypothetical protein